MKQQLFNEYLVNLPNGVFTEEEIIDLITFAENNPRFKSIFLNRQINWLLINKNHVKSLINKIKENTPAYFKIKGNNPAYFEVNESILAFLSCAFPINITEEELKHDPLRSKLVAELAHPDFKFNPTNSILLIYKAKYPDYPTTSQVYGIIEEDFKGHSVSEARYDQIMMFLEMLSHYELHNQEEFVPLFKNFLTRSHVFTKDDFNAELIQLLSMGTFTSALNRTAFTMDDGEVARESYSFIADVTMEQENRILKDMLWALHFGHVDHKQVRNVLMLLETLIKEGIKFTPASLNVIETLGGLPDDPKLTVGLEDILRYSGEIEEGSKAHKKIKKFSNGIGPLINALPFEGAIRKHNWKEFVKLFDNIVTKVETESPSFIKSFGDYNTDEVELTLKNPAVRKRVKEIAKD